MTEMQAALGVSQMSRLHDFVAKRNELAERYDDLLKKLPITIPLQIQDSYSGRHLYVIRLKLNELPLSHKDVFDKLRENGIGVNLHYIPVHTQPYYQELGFKFGQFPVAESYYSDAISLPLFHVMSVEQQDEVVNVLSKVLAES
jgi:dTDP-4-amino-4,6-dideoxygalactose transaminase